MNNDHVDEKKIPETIVLSKLVPNKEFIYNTADFEIKIISTVIIVDPANNWNQLIQQIEMWIHVSAYSMNESATEPVLKYLLPIHLFTDPYNKKPFFQLEKVINKGVFERHVNLNDINKYIHS